MPDDLRVNSWLVIPAAELHERFSRSSGPGGQSVNTADSRVELSFDVEHSVVLPEWARARALERLASRLSGGVLTIAASEQRSQLANRQAARARLADLLRDAIAPPPRPRVPTRPGRAANERRLQAKRNRAAVKRTRRYDDRNSDLARQAVTWSWVGHGFPNKLKLHFEKCLPMSPDGGSRRSRRSPSGISCVSYRAFPDGVLTAFLAIVQNVTAAAVPCVYWHGLWPVGGRPRSVFTR